jgi:PAS domain S-box-containing protein
MREEPESAAGDHPFDLVSLCRYFSEQSPLPAVAVEGATHIVRYLNPAFSRLVGKERSELIARPFWEAVPEGEGNGCLSLLDRVYRTGTPENLVEQEHRQGSPAYWSYVMWPIFGPDERPVGVMIQVTDATEAAFFRRQTTAMNESLLLSTIRQHELTEVAENLNTRLQTAIQHKNQFMAVLSHELRTPLTPVLAALWSLRRDKRLDDATQGVLEQIERNVILEARLIDDLLDMTRITQGKLELHREVIDAHVILHAAVKVCVAEAEAKELEILLVLRAKAHHVWADPIRIQQIFWNLIKNAVKFTPTGGRISLRSANVGVGRLVIEVADTGIGIEPEALSRIFEAFEQEDRSVTRRHGGLGLGLAIAKMLVDLHDGTLTVTSGGRSGGSVFRVELETTDTLKHHDQPPEPAAGAEEGLAKILLVDDNDDTLSVIARILRSSGLEVQTATSVKSALAVLGSERFDLLVSDIGLPDGSGLDIMRHGRDHLGLKGIALSGYGMDQDIQASHEAGFAHHLTKPPNFSHLIDLIRRTVS